MKKSYGPRLFALPSPVWIVGTYDSFGKPNIMTASWGGICSSEPPCVAVSVKKSRLTHVNICEQKAFTINIPSKRHITEIDYAGMVSGKNVDKFVASGLTPIRSQLVNAPYVKEFSLILECNLLKTIELGSHTQFIGQIIDVKAEENVYNESSLSVLQAVNPLISSAPDRAYFAVGEYLGKAYHIGTKIKIE